MKKLIRRLFLVKEIISKEGVIHFRRWRLLSTPIFSIYIHGIYKADEEAHLHDHPWNYLSIVLKGALVEASKEHGTYFYRDLTPLSFTSRKATKFHKIYKLYSPTVYTLFFAVGKRREWGYDVDGKWVDNVTYRKLKHQNKL